MTDASRLGVAVQDVTSLVKDAAHVQGAQCATGAAHAPKTGGEVQPPSGNTGVDSTELRRRPRPVEGVGLSVGWISCTWVGSFATLGDFCDWSQAFIGELVPANRRWRGYDVVYAGLHGVLLGLRVRDAGHLELHLDVPASVLEGMEHDALHAFLLQVAQAQNVSRCDLTLDDWCKVITPFDLDVLTSGAADAYALNKDQLVTRAKESRFIRSKGPTGGDSWYLGGTKGDVQLRVYDKARESRGEVDAVRWELQLRGDRAKEAVTMLALDCMVKGQPFSETLGSVVSSQLVRFVDFRDRSQDKNSGRCPRLPWFSALVLNVQRARPVIVKPALTVQRMHDYAQVALPSWLSTLADSASVVAGVSPETWLLSMLRAGRRKRSDRHRLALRSAGVTA